MFIAFGELNSVNVSYLNYSDVEKNNTYVATAKSVST